MNKGRLHHDEDNSIKGKIWSLLTKLKKQALHNSEHSIALGFAIGVFWGIFPTFGVGGVLSIATAYVLRANKISSLVGSFISNPITGPFFTTLTIYIATTISGTKLSIDAIWDILKGDIGFAARNIIISSTIISIVFAIIAYIIVYVILKYYIFRKAKKLEDWKNAIKHS